MLQIENSVAVDALNGLAAFSDTLPANQGAVLRALMAPLSRNLHRPEIPTAPVETPQEHPAAAEPAKEA